MTLSNRRNSDEWSKRQGSLSGHKCEECQQPLIHTYADKYICSNCGLEQIVKHKYYETDDDPNN